MNFSMVGDPITPGDEPELGPGVRGCAFDTPKGIYIPLLRAEQPGSGDVARFLDALPTDRRVAFPCVISVWLAEMLRKRGFNLGIERDAMFGQYVEVYQRCPSSTGEKSEEGTR